MEKILVRRIEALESQVGGRSQLSNYKEKKGGKGS
jgi:hypothetical protein